jgi:hypothetical protein
MATALVTKVEFPLWRLACGPYGTLLAWLLALSLLSPILTGDRNMGLFLDLLDCGVLLAALRAASPRRRVLVACAVLVLADLTTHWMAVAIPDRLSFAIHYLLSFLILAFATRIILSAIIRNTQVTIETLKAAVCVYLLLGLIWVYLYALIDLAIPGSFLIRRVGEGSRFGHLLVSGAFPKLLYFSYSTITTLGFGDILPLSGPAQTASYLEAIVGQIYLTVLIARLVGMHISQSSAKSD